MFISPPQACDKVLNTYEYATRLCSRYQLKVRGLSGEGMQIAPSPMDPDRSCKVACQDEFLRHRYYLVNGDNGYFPFGTRCSRNNDNRYCVNGKCLEFGDDNVPVVESFISLELYRSRRSTPDDSTPHTIAKRSSEERRIRPRRSFIYFEPINVTETLSPQLLQNIIDSLHFPRFEVNGKRLKRETRSKRNKKNESNNVSSFLHFRNPHRLHAIRSNESDSHCI